MQEHDSPSCPPPSSVARPSYLTKDAPPPAGSHHQRKHNHKDKCNHALRSFHDSKNDIQWCPANRLVGIGLPPMRRAHSDSIVFRTGNAPAAHRACSRSCANRAAPAARTASADPAFAASSAPIALPESGVSRNQLATIAASSWGTMCATLSPPSRGCCAQAQTSRCRTCNEAMNDYRVNTTSGLLTGDTTKNVRAHTVLSGLVAPFSAPGGSASDQLCGAPN